MNDSSESRDPLDAMGEEFLDRLRRGERPEASEFAARDPEHAGEIRDFLSALLLVEGLRPEGDPTHHGPRRDPDRSGAALERLGDFRILRELGRGGMGIVYEAEQQSLGRHVAVKVLAPGVARTSQQVQRFLREARAAARLHHTNIVPVFEVGEHDGLFYYAMQFIPGSGLDEVIREVRRLKGLPPPGTDGDVSVTRQGAYDGSATRVIGPAEPARLATSPPDIPVLSARRSEPSSLASSTDSGSRYAQAVARVGLQVAGALDYAHGQGILHRDVKPSNILLDRHGVAWVTDFGLAKATEDEDLTRTGDLVGTIRYMAPERFRGVCDAGSDVYGLGLALYELLALRAAFDAPVRESLLYQVSHVDPPRLGEVNPSVPRDLETVVHKAIEKDVSHRYTTAADLAEDLRRFLEDRPIRARRVGPTERLTRWARRNPGSASLGTALAGMLTLVVVIIAIADLRLRGEHSKTVFQLGRAERAEGDAVNKLLDSYIAHARASRRSRFAGRRFAGLEAIGQAVPLDDSGKSRSELRNEAIACMALPDLRRIDDWQGRLEDGFLGVDFDPVMGRLARGTPKGSVLIRGARGTGEPSELPGNGIPAVFLRFSPDGRHLAVKHESRGQVLLVIWDVGRAAKLLEVPEGLHSDALDFHPDGNIVAAGRRDGSIDLHDLATGCPPRRLLPGLVPRSLRFDPSGRRIAAVGINSRETVQVRLVADGTVESSWKLDEPGHSVDWHPGGLWMAVGTQSGRIRILDPGEPGRVSRSFEGHDGQVVALAFHPAGELLASASWDGILRLWDTRTGRELVKAQHPDAHPIRFSRDGRLVGPGHDGDSSWLWEVAEGDECRSLAGMETWGTATWSVGFLGPEGVIVSAGSPGVRLEIPGREGTSAFLTMPGTLGVAVTPDGSSLISSGATGVLRWPIRRPSPGEIRVGPPEPLGPLAGVPTGRIRLDLGGRTLAALVDNEGGIFRVFDLEGVKAPVTLAGHWNAERLDLSPDGRWLATGTWQGNMVKVWDVRGGEPARDLPIDGSAEVVFSPDGRRLLTASWKEHTLWDTGTWRPLARIPRSQSGSLPGVAAFSPDGRLLAVTRTRSMVQLVDVQTGEELATLEEPEPGSVCGLGFSPDGRRLAVTFNSPRLLVWDLVAIGRGLADLGLDWVATDGRVAPPAGARPTTITVQGAPWLARIQQGESLAKTGRRDEAEKALDGAISDGATHVDVLTRRGLFLWARGDKTAYRGACRDLLRRFDVTELGPRAINDVAWMCALGDAAVDDYAPLLRKIEAVSIGGQADRLNTLGALLYRAGRFTDAAQQLKRSVDAHGAGGTTYDALFLAMAHSRLGHVEEARSWLLRGGFPAPGARSRPDAIENASWIARLELNLLRREAAATVGLLDP